MERIVEARKALNFGRAPLECAPVPVARHACGDLSAGHQALLITCANGGGGSRAAAPVNPSTLGRGSTGGLRIISAVPSLELIKTVMTSAGRDSTGIKVGILVERNDVARMPVAEDIATAAAVMAADEVAEVALAGRIVTNGGLWVRLPVLPCWLRCHLREQLKIPPVTQLLSNFTRSPGSWREHTESSEVGERVTALVPAVMVLCSDIVVFAKCSRFGELRIRAELVVGTQNGWHVHRLATASWR